MKCMPMKLKVRIFEGKSPELYLAVGHFVLSPACLRENNNYPYKSSRMFTWHVLYHADQVCLLRENSMVVIKLIIIMPLPIGRGGTSC